MNQEFLTQLQQHLGRDPEDFITQQVAQGYPVLVFPPAEVPDFFQQKRELRNWTLTPVLNPEVRTREILALPKTNTARAVYKQGQPLRIQRITGCEPTWASRYMNRARGTDHAMQESVIRAVYWICQQHWVTVSSMTVEQVRHQFGNVTGLSRKRIESAIQIAHLMMGGHFYYVKSKRRPEPFGETGLYVRVKPGVYHAKSQPVH